MSDADLLALAEAAGVAPRWRDAFGSEHDVAPDTLRAVLRRARPAGRHATPRSRDSRAHLDAQRERGRCRRWSPADAGRPIRLRVDAGRFRITLEDGGAIEGAARRRRGRRRCRADRAARAITGWNSRRRRRRSRSRRRAAVARRCRPPRAAAGGWRRSSTALRRAGRRRDRRFRGAARFRARGRRARRGRRRDQPGARAVLRRPRPLQPVRAVQPDHAERAARGRCRTPTTPSARGWRRLPLVDWPAAARARLARLRRAFDAPGRDRAALEHVPRGARATRWKRHARFEALHAHLFGAGSGPLALARLARGLPRPDQPGGRGVRRASMRRGRRSTPGCNSAPTAASPRRRRRRAPPGCRSG